MTKKQTSRVTASHIMLVLNYLGRVFILLALILLGLGLFLWLSGEDVTQPAGQLWYNLHVESLNFSQVIIQRHLGLPGFWDEFILPHLLTRPAWESIILLFMGFFIIGGLLASLGRSVKKRRSFR